MPHRACLCLIAGSGLPVETAETWLLRGVALVQYRNKRADRATRRKEAAMLGDACRARGAGLIINDDVELAAATRADGVHLGKDDPDVSQARRTLGDEAIIGVSCYDSLERALTAQREGADYLAFGSLFASRTKPEAVRITLENLAEYKRRLHLPVCAVGGVTRDNLDRVLAAGADLVAVNADVADASDPAAAVKGYLKKLGSSGEAADGTARRALPKLNA